MNLRDKASKINFASLISDQPVSRTPGAPKTAPGEMMAFANDRRSEMLRENDELRAKVAITESIELRLSEAETSLKAWDGAAPVRTVDPKLIRRGRLANRDIVNFTGPEFESFKQEILDAGGNVVAIKSFKQEILDAGGNVVAIKIRPVNDDSGCLYELVFGHRRHQAALETSTPLLALIVEMDDKSAYEEMERENRGHTKPSPWEQGVSYARALETGLYSSARQCAAALGVDQSNMVKALALANLPIEIVKAFFSPLDLQLSWGPDLKAAVETDGDNVLRRAIELRAFQPQLSSKQVFNQLVAASTAKSNTGPAVASTDMNLSSQRSFLQEGRKIARMKQEKHKTEIVIFTPLTADRQHELSVIVAKFLNATVGEGHQGAARFHTSESLPGREV